METGDIIVFIPPTLFSIVSAAFLLLWHMKIISAWQWSAGFAQTAVGFVLSTFSIEPHFDAFSSGMVFIGASYCYGSGLLSHFESEGRRKERLAFVAVYTVLLAHAVFVEGSLVYQLFLTDAGFALLLGFSVWSVALKARRPVDIALVIATGVVVLDSVARTVFFTFFTSSSDDLADFASSAYNLAVHVSTITVCMIFPFTALGAIASKAIELHRAEADRDPLTGLLNRRGLDKILGKILSSPGAVMVCDIDHFKRINDSFGHAIGDKVIIALAHELQEAIGPIGHVARVGGEEFLVYLPGYALQDASEIANRLRASFSGRNWNALGIHRSVSVSIGLSNTRLGDRDLEHAILRADDAMYSAKTRGRNQVAAIEETTATIGAFEPPGRSRRRDS